MLLDDGKGKKEERVALPVRVPKSLLDYVRKRAGEKRGEVTRVIEQAVQLHRALYGGLKEHKFQIQQFAINEKLDWVNDEAEVYVRLVKRGLEAGTKR